MVHTSWELMSLNDSNAIPQIGLGVWRAEDGKEVEDAVTAALETGYRLIDTAAVYGNEVGVGNAIRSSGVPRDELFVTTKLWNSDQGAANVRPALEESLRKLQLDYIDLYLIHWPTPAKGLYVETWKEFEKMQSEGLVRSIGVSNFTIEHLEQLKEHSGVVPAVNQIELHPDFSQKELREYCAKAGILVESWSPIGGSRGNILQNTSIINIGKNYGKTSAQIIIRWHIQHGLIVIPKSVQPERIKENFDVFDFELSEEDMARIDSLNSDNRQGPDPVTMNTA